MHLIARVCLNLNAAQSLFPFETVMLLLSDIIEIALTALGDVWNACHYVLQRKVKPSLLGDTIHAKQGHEKQNLKYIMH